MNRRPGYLLGGTLVAALAVRLASVHHGLPYAYNSDEQFHFVPHAAAAADGDWNPRYFDNPSAFTYLMALVFKLVFHGDDVTDRLAEDPTAVFAIGRIVVVLLGTAVVAAVAWLGSREFDATVGILSAAIVAFGFLPVYYSHLALNDVPTMLPATVCLAGCLAIYRRGSGWTYLWTGAALGVAVGTKYLAAPLAGTVALAAVLTVIERRERPVRAIVALAGAALASLVALASINPYLVVEFELARTQFSDQASHAAMAKLGQAGSGWAYYPGTLLWGFGLLPAFFALLGVIVMLRRDLGKALIVASFPVMLYVYMGGQERFFGRWMLACYPALALLAGYGVRQSARWVTQRLAGSLPNPGTRAVSWALPVLAALVLLQPIVDSVRSDIVLGRTDTRDIAREMIAERVDGNHAIVVEPAVPAGYLSTDHYIKYPIDRPYQDYETRLLPELVEDYQRTGYCWVLVSSHQRDRGEAAGLTAAAEYYAELDRQSRRTTVISPYRDGAEPPGFSYDLSFNWYPLAYERPGPLMTLHQLTDCSNEGDPR